MCMLLLLELSSSCISPKSTVRPVVVDNVSQSLANGSSADIIGNQKLQDNSEKREIVYFIPERNSYNMDLRNGMQNNNKFMSVKNLKNQSPCSSSSDSEKENEIRNVSRMKMLGNRKHRRSTKLKNELKNADHKSTQNMSERNIKLGNVHYDMKKPNAIKNEPMVSANYQEGASLGIKSTLPTSITTDDRAQIYQKELKQDTLLSSGNEKDTVVERKNVNMKPSIVQLSENTFVFHTQEEKLFRQIETAEFYAGKIVPHNRSNENDLVNQYDGSKYEDVVNFNVESESTAKIDKISKEGTLLDNSSTNVLVVMRSNSSTFLIPPTSDHIENEQNRLMIQSKNFSNCSPIDNIVPKQNVMREPKISSDTITTVITTPEQNVSILKLPETSENLQQNVSVLVSPEIANLNNVVTCGDISFNEEMSVLKKNELLKANFEESHTAYEEIKFTGEEKTNETYLILQKEMVIKSNNNDSTLKNVAKADCNNEDISGIKHNKNNALERQFSLEQKSSKGKNYEKNDKIFVASTGNKSFKQINIENREEPNISALSEGIAMTEEVAIVKEINTAEKYSVNKEGEIVLASTVNVSQTISQTETCVEPKIIPETIMTIEKSNKKAYFVEHKNNDVCNLDSPNENITSECKDILKRPNDHFLVYSNLKMENQELVTVEEEIVSKTKLEYIENNAKWIRSQKGEKMPKCILNPNESFYHDLVFIEEEVLPEAKFLCLMDNTKWISPPEEFFQEETMLQAKKYDDDDVTESRQDVVNNHVTNDVIFLPSNENVNDVMADNVDALQDEYLKHLNLSEEEMLLLLQAKQDGLKWVIIEELHKVRIPEPLSEDSTDAASVLFGMAAATAAAGFGSAISMMGSDSNDSESNAKEIALFQETDVRDSFELKEDAFDDHTMIDDKFPAVLLLQENDLESVSLEEYAINDVETVNYSKMQDAVLLAQEENETEINEISENCTIFLNEPNSLEKADNELITEEYQSEVKPDSEDHTSSSSKSSSLEDINKVVVTEVVVKENDNSSIDENIVAGGAILIGTANIAAANAADLNPDESEIAQNEIINGEDETFSNEVVEFVPMVNHDEEHVEAVVLVVAQDSLRLSSEEGSCSY